MLLGLDVSAHQGDHFPWDQARGQGVAFAFAKASEGVWNGARDQHFGRNLRGMRDEGIIPGAYHYLVRASHPDTGEPGVWAGGAAQCDWFVDQLPRNDPDGLLVGVDFETMDPGYTRTHDGVEWD